MSRADALEHRLLRSFNVLAEELHFGRAAARLHISQPPLSVQIRTLEERIGARLFERDRRRVALTEAGRFLQERSSLLIAEAERFFDEASRIGRGESGVLAIGYSPTATYEVLPPKIHAFAQRWPGIRLEMIEMRSREQSTALIAGRIEIGYACGPVGVPDIEEKVVARERFLALLPRRHRLARASRLRLADLDGEACVSVRPDIEPAWADACARAVASRGIRLLRAQETDSKVALLGLVAAGLGFAFVSESMRRLGRTGVVFREISDLTVRVPLVRLSRPEPSPRAQRWLDL